MIQRVLLTCSSQSYSEEQTKISELIKSAFANLHGATFKSFAVQGPVESRSLPWVKIALIRKFIDLADEILWLDCDIVLKDIRIDLFEALKKARSATQFVFSANKDSSSVFLLDCRDKERVKTFLNDWWNEAEPRFFDTAPYDTSVWKTWTALKKDTMFHHNEWSFQKEEAHPHLLQVSKSDYKLATDSLLKKYLYKIVKSTVGSVRKRIAIAMRSQNFYSNGAGQNCIFMRQTMEACGYEVDFVIHAKETTASTDLPFVFKEFQTLDLDQYELFVFGSTVLPKDATDLLRSKKIKCVMFNPCNVIDQFHQENFLYAEHSASTPLFEMTFHSFADEIWITDNHAESSLEYLQIINRFKIPVKPIPLMWSPLFLHKDSQLPSYVQRAPSAQVDFVILEPNLGYCKSAWLPLVICENFYLKHPEKVNKIYLFNAPDSNKTAMGMMKSLKIGEDDKIKYMKRLPINDILSFFSNPAKNNGNHVIFVSHSVNSPLNYAYFDILHSGFPFVHNSPYLKKSGIGFSYSTLFEGMDQISKCLEFDVRIEKTKALKYLSRIDPYSDFVVGEVRNLLTPVVAPVATVSHSVVAPVVAPVSHPVVAPVATVSHPVVAPVATVSHPVVAPVAAPVSHSPPTLSIVEIPPTPQLVAKPLKDRLQILLISCNKRRQQVILEAYKHLNIPFDIEIFQAYTPENSKDYLNFKTPEYQERDSLICCSRSHAGAIHQFVTKSTKELLLILEDDVLFVKKDFEKELEKAVEIYERNLSEIDYVSIGYIFKETPPKSSKQEGSLLWNLQQNLWGTQGYLVNRSVAIDMDKTLWKPSAFDLSQALRNDKRQYADKGLALSPDHFLSVLWRQAFVHPMLVVEDPSIQSTIWDFKNQYRRDQLTTSPDWARSLDDFYIPPPPTPLVITYDNNPTDNSRFYFETLQRNGWDYKWVGEGKTFDNFAVKMKRYCATVSSLHPQQIVVLTDSRDMFCMRPPQMFCELFKKQGKPIMVSMELFCGGYNDVPEHFDHFQCKPLHKYWRHHKYETFPMRKFVNSGLIAGYAKDVCEMLRWILDKGFKDDQLGLGCFMCEFPEKVYADIHAEFLHTSTFGMYSGLDTKDQRNDSPTLAELYGRSAYFLHIPGLINIKGQMLMYETIKNLLQHGFDSKKINDLYPQDKDYFKKYGGTAFDLCL